MDAKAFFEGKPLHAGLFVLGVAVIFITVYIQYFVPLGTVTGYLVVYGIPVAVVSLLFGRQILRHAGKNNKEGFKFGLGLFSSFYLIGIFLSVVALAIILQFSPSAEELLTKTNPVLDVSPTEAWIMMAVAMLVVGPAEEYLFRGFLFGGMLSISKGRHWVALAVLSAVIFALAHGYYAVTYSIASPVYFIQIITFGVAMAVVYYWSGGNIVALAVVHGTNDAIGFLGVATSSSVSLATKGIFVGIGIFLALYYILLKKVRMKPFPRSESSAQSEPLPTPPLT